MYYFLSGLPRSGSTLLSAILNQNSDIHVSTSSPVAHLMWQNENYISEDDFYQSHPKEKFKKNFISSIIEQYYDDVQSPYVIDKNRIWTGSIPLLYNYITNEPKILCPVRKVSEILQSLITLMEKSPGNVIDQNLTPPYTLQKRCEYLLSSESVVMAGVQQILNAPRDILHFIEYDDIINYPEQTIESIYQFLNLPYYEHSFDDIQNRLREDDTVYGMPTMHDVKRTLIKTNHVLSLPDDIIRKCDKIDVAIRYKMNEEHSYPSLPDQGKNLAKFTFELVKRALQGGALTVSSEVKEQRLEMCRTCEWYDASQIRCRHCGCFLEEKATFALDSCPIGKWTESDEDWTNGRFDELVKELDEFQETTDVLPVVSFPEDPEVGQETVMHDVKWIWNGIHWEYVPN